jgi:hypothetical protein
MTMIELCAFDRRVGIVRYTRRDNGGRMIDRVTTVSGLAEGGLRRLRGVRMLQVMVSRAWI